MGTVYQAHDALGHTVAIKVLRMADQDLEARFAREARTLQAMQHPGIVRYLDSGTHADGSPFLVMEWLEGHDLARHLRQSALSLEDALECASAIAEALAVVHAQGIVHRDIKPGNIFLVGGLPTTVKLIDFGIAKLAGATTRLTSTGKIMGTPNYMAPEQVQDQVELDGRTDIFALGCVLHECLTGSPPFTASSAMSVIARVLHAPAERLRDRHMDIPDALDELLARMLSKERDERPATAAQVAAELGRILAALGPEARREVPGASARLTALTPDEQRMASLVVLAQPHDALSLSVSAPTMPLASSGSRTTPVPEEPAFERIDGNTLAVVLDIRGAAIDQAAHAAHLALRLRTEYASPALALVTGPVQREHARLCGPAVARAAALLALASPCQDTPPEQTAGIGDASDAPPMLPRIVVDEATAGLLYGHFEMRAEDGYHVLVGRNQGLSPPPLFGRATPFVGRTREMAILTATLAECIQESVARAVLVLGPAGMGKSRLVAELVRTVASQRGALGMTQKIEIWCGRGDPIRASSPLYIVADAIRQAAGIHDGASLAERWSLLRAFVASVARTHEIQRISEFLGELLDTPASASVSVELMAARRDPALMSEQILRACEDLIGRLTTSRPLLLVLEDLQWGDPGTVALIERLLRNLSEAPLLMVAVGRPDLAKGVPRLQGQSSVTELCVGPLTRRAAETLVREVLAPILSGALDNSRVDALIERGSGNPLFLEELMRSAARGDWTWPASVLVMVETRLEQLELRARLVLRAASVFGSGFWLGGVIALLGDHLGAEEWLEHLVQEELIKEEPVPRFPGQQQYRFCHATLRECAYQMLTHEDRQLGHRLAGQWLETMGETHPTTLAQHFELGGAPERALPYYVQAAEDALERSALDSARLLAQRGLACGAQDELRGQLLRVLADVEVWCGNMAEVARLYEEAILHLPARTRAWYDAIAEAGLAYLKLGQPERTEALTRALRGMPADGPAPGHDGGLGQADRDAGISDGRLIALGKLAEGYLTLGRRETGDELARALTAQTRGRCDPVVLAHVHLARGFCAFEVHRDLAEAALELEQGIAHLQEVGDYRQACMHQVNLGYVKLSLGLHAEAEHALRAALAAAKRLGLGLAVAYAKRELGIAVARLAHGYMDGGRREAGREDAGRVDASRVDGYRRIHIRLAEAEELEDSAASWLEEYGDPLAAAQCRTELAAVRLARGVLGPAEAAARAAIALLAGSQHEPRGAPAFAVLSQILGRAGRIQEAVAAAEEAYRLQAGPDATEPDDALVSVALAEALMASGARARARDVVRAAQERLHASAQAISNPAWREGFVHGVPLHARLAALADELLVRS